MFDGYSEYTMHGVLICGMYVCVTHLVLDALFRDPRELGLECAEELCGRGLQPGLGAVRDGTAEQSYWRHVFVIASRGHELL